jgi:hypothetical protein
MNIRFQHITNLVKRYPKFELHSDDWFKNRSWSFGGSEASHLLDKELDFEKFLKNKTNHQSQNKLCVWGLMFEKIAIELIKRECEEKKMEFRTGDTVYHTKYPLSYSPDGYIMNGKELHLVEIKCPYYRSTKSDLTKQYRYQIQIGMYLLPVDDCIFYRFKFRSCTLSDMSNNFSYRREEHSIPFKKNYKFKLRFDEPCLCKGIIIFNEKNSLGCSTSSEQQQQQQQILFDVTENMDQLCDLDYSNIEYHIFDSDIDYMNIYSIIQNLNKKYLLWKLFDINKEYIKRNKTYITKIKNSIWDNYEKLIDSKKNEKI